MKNIKKLGLLILLGLVCNTACEVEGGRRSTSSSSSSQIIISSNSQNSSNSIISSSSSSSSSISTGLPMSSQEFIDAVNAIVIDINAGDAISNAFILFDSLEEWDYPEVLEAYNKLCQLELDYLEIVSNQEEINLFLEKVTALPEVITLEDEYLIVRAEDSYEKLGENLKSDASVIEAYNKMVTARESFDVLYNEMMEQKDAEAVAEFLGFVNSLPAVENLTYSHYFTIQNAIDQYELLSENAKTFEGVAEGYSKLQEAHSLINVLDGTNLFDINIIHKGNNWEAILHINAKDEVHKITGTNKVHELRVYEDGAQMIEAKMLSWGGVTYPYSYTQGDGTHLFAYTFLDYYVAGSVYLISFIVETAAKEAYAVSYYYVVDGSFTCGGYSEIELYKEQLRARFNELYREDYTDENWSALEVILEEGLLELDTATTPEHARIITNQYYFEMSGVEKRFSEITGMSVIEVSSVDAQKGTIVDDNLGSSWQAASTVNEYVIIDLGDTYPVEGLTIVWEVANAKNYDIKLSNENANWEMIESVYKYRNGESGNRTDEIRFESEECRYIKLELKTGSTQWGFRIFEIDVYSSKVVEPNETVTPEQ